MIDLRQNKGFALTFTLIFMFLIVSFMAVYILTVASGVSEANRVANAKKAYYIADAGLADAYERITQAGVNTVASNNSYIPSITTDNGVYSVGTTSGNYAVAVVYSNSPRSNYTITSVGTYGNISKTLQLKIIGASISKYAYWSQTESNPAFGGPLWWVGEPGMEMLTNGPVQTNGQLNIFGNPIFNGPVTEANLPSMGTTPNYYPGVASNPNQIFLGGIENNAPAVDLPPQPTLNAINTIAADGSGLILTGASTVIFNPTGTITVTGNVLDSNCTATTKYKNTTISAPANGVVYVQSTSTIPKCNSSAQDGTVTVQGTVSGQLTVAADQNINVSGSVAYNSDPRTHPSSTDLLGLVANQNITVIEASAPAQLEMSAVMVALQGSFQVDQYWVYKGNATTAVMDQFGSLINYVCGATGEIDMSGNLLGGWNQIQAYDSRLGTLAPPGFPPYVNNAGDGVYTKVSIAEL
jgi:hypothetical protein